LPSAEGLVDWLQNSTFGIPNWFLIVLAILVLLVIWRVKQ